jgi:hypothetical protein
MKADDAQKTEVVLGLDPAPTIKTASTRRVSWEAPRLEKLGGVDDATFGAATGASNIS